MNTKWRYPKDKALCFEEKQKQHVLDSIKKDNVLHLKQKNQKKRKALYGIITAAVLFLSLIVSSYVSPVMAKVVAKIPYFSLFIKQEEYKYAIYNVVSEVAQEKKYKINDIDLSVPERELALTLVGSKGQVDKLKSNVIKDMNARLIAENFGKFDIIVNRVDSKVWENKVRDLSPEEKQNEQKTNELQAKVEEYLKNNNYVTPFPPQVRINKIEKYMYVSITKSEKRYTELEQAMRELSKPYSEEFKIDIRKSDLTARQQEVRWEKNNIIGVIGSGLMENKEFKVKGFSYSFHPLPLQIIVRVSVDSIDSEAKELAEKIKYEIDTFIKSDELTKDVRADPYVVTVYSKDKKKINK